MTQLDNSRLQQISRMEQTLNDTDRLLDAAERLLEQWTASIPAFGQLMNYYENGEWIRDYDASNAGLLPPDMPCGVLSQDGVYNTLARQQALALAYMKLAVAILGNEFEQPDRLAQR